MNIYNWSNSLPIEIVEQFTEETGIPVTLDIYDSGDIMEVKMLAGNSGYDLVFVTAAPYLERQIQLGIYTPLDKEKISNYKLLDPIIMNHLSVSDPENKHSIPFVWGTTGFGANKTKILELFPDAPLDSFSLFFDKDVAAKLAPCGIELLDSPIEVFPAVFSYLGLDPNNSNVEDLKKATKLLLEVKPYIRKFQPVASPRSLALGEVCLAQGWSGDVLQAHTLAQELGSNDDIIYVIAKEGGYLWVDAMTIPLDAPHPKLAYIFLNFMLRPDVIAKVTSTIQTANAVPASKKYIPESIRNNPMIYPPTEDIKKLDVDIIQPAQYERLRSREWTRVKTGR